MRVLAILLAGAAGACSAPREASPPPATLDERRALAEAQAMIPASEIPAAAATPTGTASAAR